MVSGSGGYAGQSLRHPHSDHRWLRGTEQTPTTTEPMNNPNKDSDSRVETYEDQLEMVREWTQRTGQTCGTAEIILGDRKEAMTQETFLRTEGIRMELDDVLDSEEMLAELPEWFPRLPRGDSPGLY